MDPYERLVQHQDPDDPVDAGSRAHRRGRGRRGAVLALAGVVSLAWVTGHTGSEDATQAAAAPTVTVTPTTVITPTTTHTPTETAQRATVTGPERTVEVTPTVTVTPPPPPPAPTTTPAPRPTQNDPVAPQPQPPQAPAGGYQNCTAARAAGAAPVYRGDPGYAPRLDRDGDGVGCESR